MSIHVVVTYKDYPDSKTDERICRLARKNDDGSGFGYGLRDMSFIYRNPTEANAAIRRLRRAGYRVFRAD